MRSEATRSVGELLLPFTSSVKAGSSLYQFVLLSRQGHPCLSRHSLLIVEGGLGAADRLLPFKP